MAVEDKHTEELETLRQQLEEAQETIRAIRSGEIDALLISGRQGGQVFALKNTDRPYRVMVEVMQEGAVTLLPNGMILYSNRRFAEMLNIPLDEVFGTSLHTLVAFSDKVFFADLLKQSLLSTGRGEVVLCGTDGRLVPVSIALSPLFLDGISAIGMVVTDLTEQKHRERELELLQKLQSAVSEAKDVQVALSVVLAMISESQKWTYGEAWTASPDGGVLRCTSTWHSSKATLNEVLQKPPSMALSPADDAIGQTWNNRKLMLIRDVGVDSQFTRPDLAARLGLKSAFLVPILAGEAVVAVLAFFADKHYDADAHFLRLLSTIAGELGSFVHRKQMEESLLKAHHELERRVEERTAELTEMNRLLQEEIQARTRLAEAEAKARHEAEVANEAKLQFLGMISHELRTPLTSIKGFVSTLLSEDITWDSEQQQEFLTIADQEADKLTNLVDQLLDLASLQSNRIQIMPNVLKFSDIVAIAEAELDALTQEHQLRFQLADDLPSVLADPQRIAQVLVNLVSNAAKYSPAGSVIALTAFGRGSNLQVDVADFGPGIVAEDREIIFEAFRRLERKKGEQVRRGAGLGLAICKGLVEAHGGKIWIDPTYNQGTKICFTLPSSA